MQALVYTGPGGKALQDHVMPVIAHASDAIVRVTLTTICGTDLRVLKGEEPICKPGTVLGHEGVGVVHAVGSAVTTFLPGDPVLISCISACGRCEACRAGMYAHCTTGGWILGNSIDGTQAEFVRIPHADTSLHPIPEGTDEEALLMLGDILPTGFEYGALCGKVRPGSAVAIVGTGPISLAALLAAQLYSPAEIIMIDLDDRHWAVGRRFGATTRVNSTAGDAAEQVMKLTRGRGVDTAIETIGTPAMSQLCQDIVVPGGKIVSMGVHGVMIEWQREGRWSPKAAIPMLLRSLGSKCAEAPSAMPHRFTFDKIIEAYDTFAKATDTKALKVVVDMNRTAW